MSEAKEKLTPVEEKIAGVAATRVKLEEIEEALRSEHLQAGFIEILMQWARDGEERVVDSLMLWYESGDEQECKEIIEELAQWIVEEHPVNDHMRVLH